MTVLTHPISFFSLIITFGQLVVITKTEIIEVLPNIRYEFVHIKAIDGKPTLLFLHVFPSSFHAWRHQTEYFSKQGYGCLVPNLIGYGNTYSPLNETEYSSRSIVEHLIALLNRVNLGNATVFVIGHDWGARTASRFVLYHPERTIGAVLLSVAYSPPVKFNLSLVLQQSLQLNGYESIGYWEFFKADDASEIIERNVDSFIDLLFASNSTLARTDLAPVGQVRRWLENGKRTERASYMTVYDYETARSYLVKGMQPKLNWFKVVIANIDWGYEQTLNATVRRPVLYIEGNRDYIGIIGAAERQRNYIADLEIIKVDTGHWVMEEKPEEVNREIDRWIKKVLSNSAAASSLLMAPYLCFFILYFFLNI